MFNKMKMERRWKGEDVIDLGMGNPVDPAPDTVISKLCEIAQDTPLPDGRRHEKSAAGDHPLLPTKLWRGPGFRKNGKGDGYRTMIGRIAMVSGTPRTDTVHPGMAALFVSDLVTNGFFSVL